MAVGRTALVGHAELLDKGDVVPPFDQSKRGAGPHDSSSDDSYAHVLISGRLTHLRKNGATENLALTRSAAPLLKMLRQLFLFGLGFLSFWSCSLLRRSSFGSYRLGSLLGSSGLWRGLGSSLLGCAGRRLCLAVAVFGAELTCGIFDLLLFAMPPSVDFLVLNSHGPVLNRKQSTRIPLPGLNGETRSNRYSRIRI